MKKVICSEHAPAHRPVCTGNCSKRYRIYFGSASDRSRNRCFSGRDRSTTKQSLTNVKAILAEAGTGMDQVIKTTVFLSDMNNSRRDERGLRHLLR